MRPSSISWLLSIGAAVALGAATVSAAGPGGLNFKAVGKQVSSLEVMIRKRRTSALLQLADTKLAEDPDSPDALALHGIVNGILGWPTETVVAFELAMGGEIFEQEGLPYYAGALRDLGRGREAAALRREQRLVPTPNIYAHIGIEANIVDDLRVAEAWEEAEEAAELFLNLEPGNAIAHSTVAELMWAMGDVDEAMFQLFLVQQVGERSYRYREVLARIAYDEGLLDEAAEELVRVRKQRPRLPRVRAMQLDVVCELGEEDKILAEFDYPRFADQRHPDLLVSEMRCRHRRGEHALVRQLADDLRALYPDLPRVQAALQSIEASSD